MTKMLRPGFFKTALASAAALALPLCFGRTVAAQPAPKYNVLLIPIDDLRPELGCYGNQKAITPNIDRLAAEGTVFARAYCQQAVCAPSRASLLTGLRPDSTSIYNLTTPLRSVLPNVVTLPQLFKEAGYVTIQRGKVYHHPDDDASSFSDRDVDGSQQWLDHDNVAAVMAKRAEAAKQGLKGPAYYRNSLGPATEATDVPDSAYPDGINADKSVALIQKYAKQPFFFACGFYRPHLPFNAPTRYWDLYQRDSFVVPSREMPTGASKYLFWDFGELRAYSDIPKAGLLDDDISKRLIHGYYASVSYVDAQIGKVLKALDDNHLRDRTIVILFGDHGWKLGEYGNWCKHSNAELDTHAPLIVRVPGMTAGQRTEALTEFVDIYPTLAELCGIKAPATLEGTSFVPLLKDPQRQWKSAAFSQYPRDGGIMGYSLRSGPWRYTQWVDTHKTGADRIVDRELYDQAKGPVATANVAGDPANASLVAGFDQMIIAGWKGALPVAK